MSIYLCVKQREITTFKGSIYKFFYTVVSSNGTPGTRKCPFKQCVSMLGMVPGAAKSCPVYGKEVHKNWCRYQK
jgi:hypothetical protein